MPRTWIKSNKYPIFFYGLVAVSDKVVCGESLATRCWQYGQALDTSCVFIEEFVKSDSNIVCLMYLIIVNM